MILTLIVAAIATDAPKCYTVHDVVIGAGTNIGPILHVPDVGGCCDKCSAYPGCKAWTYHPDTNACYLHSSDSTPQIGEKGVISGAFGVKPKPPAPTPPPLPPLPPPHMYPDAASACAAFNTTVLIELMHGFGWGTGGIDGYTRNSGCGNACGRPYFRWDNGPQGFDDGAPAGNATQWPSSLNMGATWDPELALEWGVAMGEEFWGKGTNIFEGPGVNVARIEKNGRTFEYLSGEDPVLGSALASPVVHGVQQHVMAIGKHYILNNQETDRSGGNEVCDETTLMELYAPPFAAMANKVAGYMCSYNRVNGVYACENPHTLKTMLKGQFNFTGFVVSDWGATHSTSEAINAGLDIDMPDNKYFNQDTIKAALAVGNFTVDRLRDSCLRIMSGWYELPSDKRFPCDGGSCVKNNVSTPAHKQLARKLSAMSTVLLQNNGDLLPLAKAKGIKVALIGSDAAAPYTAGQGSGGVPNSNVAVSPLQAFQSIAGITVVYEPGNTTNGVAMAASAAAAADVAIVFGSAHSGEGKDRPNLLFWLEHGKTITTEAIITAVAKAQPKTVVVAAVPGQILTDWRDSVAAILVPFLPGEQYGNAIVDIIFGDVTPQAKLPLSFPKVDNEQGMTVSQWPGLNTTKFGPCKSNGCTKESTYTEGQIVGYRWYDKKQVKPAFAFGHGLTYGGGYTYSALKTDGRTISFVVTGTGCDTPQVYIGYPAAATDPKVPSKVLRGFQKTCAGTATVSHTLSDKDVSNWNEDAKAYTVTRGEYTVYVGSSSQDIRLTGTITI